MIIKSIEPSIIGMDATHSGSARLIAEIFDQRKPDSNKTTYVASLCVETGTRTSLLSVKRWEFDTYTEARDQIAIWADLYDLEAN